MESTEQRFDRLGLAVMAALAKAEPDLDTHEAYSLLLKCIGDLLLSEPVSQGDRVTAIKEMSKTLIGWVSTARDRGFSTGDDA